MGDITIIHYTANKIEDPFASNIRNHLLSWLPEGTPIISVSHKPMDYGENICIPDLEYSIYNIYVQILVGCKAAKTRYIMCQEDDALYNLEHFSHRPPDDTFAYNLNRWIIDNDIFFHRNRANMSMCMAPTALMIETLETRFEKFPNVMSRAEMGAVGGFGEPGRLEARMGLPPVKLEVFNTINPTLVFNHRPSVGGIRKVTNRDIVRNNLDPWGNAIDLWVKMYEIE